MTIAKEPSDRWGRWMLGGILISILVQMFRFIAIPIVLGVLAKTDPYEWMYPALLDIVVAVIAPFVAYLLWRKRGYEVWTLATVFFTVSLLDHFDTITVFLISPNLPHLFQGMLAGSTNPALSGIVTGPGSQAVIDLVAVLLLTMTSVKTFIVNPKGEKS